MSAILIVGLLTSTLVAFFFRRRTRHVPVSRLLTSQGFSEDAVAAIRDERGDAVITVTLEDGREFKTTAAEAGRRLQTRGDAKRASWVEEIGSNKLAILLAIVGYVISIVLFYLT